MNETINQAKSFMLCWVDSILRYICLENLILCYFLSWTTLLDSNNFSAIVTKLISPTYLKLWYENYKGLNRVIWAKANTISLSISYLPPNKKKVGRRIEVDALPQLSWNIVWSIHSWLKPLNIAYCCKWQIMVQSIFSHSL